MCQHCDELVLEAVGRAQFLFRLFAVGDIVHGTDEPNRQAALERYPTDGLNPSDDAIGPVDPEGG